MKLRDGLGVRHTQIINIFADFRNSMSAGRNTVYWGPGRLLKKFEKDFASNKRLCKTDISTKTKKMNFIGEGKVWNKSCWKWFMLLFRKNYFDEIWKMREVGQKFFWRYLYNWVTCLILFPLRWMSFFLVLKLISVLQRSLFGTRNIFRFGSNCYTVNQDPN